MMGRLVLSRHLDESVVLHKDGEVIAEVKYTKSNDNGSIRLTFSADTDIEVDRQEIFKLRYPSLT